MQDRCSESSFVFLLVNFRKITDVVGAVVTLRFLLHLLLPEIRKKMFITAELESMREALKTSLVLSVTMILEWYSLNFLVIHPGGQIL